MCAHRGKTVSSQWEGCHLQARTSSLWRNRSCRTLTLDFQPPEQWENEFLLFEPPYLRYFILAAPADWDSHRASLKGSHFRAESGKMTQASILSLSVGMSRQRRLQALDAVGQQRGWGSHLCWTPSRVLTRGPVHLELCQGPRRIQGGGPSRILEAVIWASPRSVPSLSAGS